MIECVLVENALTRVPNDAGIDLLLRVSKVDRFEAENVVARSRKKQNLAGVKQRCVHWQYLRKIGKQSPYAFCGGSVDIKLKVGNSENSGIHCRRVVDLKQHSLAPSHTERRERQAAPLVFPGTPSIKFDPWAPTVLHFALIAYIPADSKPSCIFLGRIVDLENNDLWAAIPI